MIEKLIDTHFTLPEVKVRAKLMVAMEVGGLVSAQGRPSGRRTPDPLYGGVWRHPCLVKGLGEGDLPCVYGALSRELEYLHPSHTRTELPPPFAARFPPTIIRQITGHPSHRVARCRVVGAARQCMTRAKEQRLRMASMINSNIKIHKPGLCLATTLLCSAIYLWPQWSPVTALLILQTGRCSLQTGRCSLQTG